MMTRAVDETAVIAALRDGDESVFAELVDQHTPSMLRVARGYVPSHEIAEEVVQETWIALVKGIGKFEGRSSLRTWLFTVMINIAKARGVRERRESDAAIAAFTGGTVDPARFRESGDPYPGHWKPDEVPSPFPDTPEGSVLGRRTCRRSRNANWTGCRIGSESWSPCVTCWGSTRARCANCSTSASPINGCCCTAAGRSFGPRWRTIWGTCHEDRSRWTATSSSSLSPPTLTARSIRTPVPASTCTCTECDGCENYLQQFRETVRTVGKIGNDELDPAFRSRLLEAFKDFR